MTEIIHEPPLPADSIDAHVHVWRANPAFPIVSASIVGPHSPVPVELLDEYLEEHRVARAVLVQPIYAGVDNRYVAECARARPDRFAAVCVLDPRDTDAPRQLAFWAGEQGCRGVRLRPRIAAESAALGDPSTFPIWEQAEKQRVVVSVLANPEHLATIKMLADRFSRVPILVDHLAHPHLGDTREADESRRDLLALSDCQNVWIKTSGFCYFSRESFPYRDCHTLLGAILDRFGSSRLVWGSDFPHVLLRTPYGRIQRVLALALPRLNAVDVERIFRDNARRLYWPQQ